MGLRDFALLGLVCLFWGLNIVLSRYLIVEGGWPPLFYAAMRFGLIALALMPFLWPVPSQWRGLALVSICLGSGHFGLLFLGLSLSEASAAAVVGQLGVPFTTILSIMFLNERIGWRRSLGIALSFLGVVIISFNPESFSFGVGLMLIALSAFLGAIGGVTLKRITPLPALKMQAWLGLYSVFPLIVLSLVFETGQVSALTGSGPEMWAILAFAVLAVSIFGHSTFYNLIKRHDMSLLSPLTLMTPIWSVIFAILLLNEALTVQLVIGGAVALLGVGIVAIRSNTAVGLEATSIQRNAK
jgi:O-acetylserine/cysteine efflux transporter